MSFFGFSSMNSMGNSIQVSLEVPPEIMQGLQTGQLERIGGVIRESDTGRIVAWLRDVAENSEPSEVGDTLMNTVMRASGRQSLVATTSTGAVGGLSSMMLLNVGVSVISTGILIWRIQKLSKEIEQLSLLVKAEFRHERMASLETALAAAEDALNMKNPELRQQAFGRAVYDLDKARQDLLAYFDEAMATAKTPIELFQAQQLLITAMQIEMTRLRCYMEFEEIDSAKQKMQKVKPEFEQRTHNLIRAYLGTQTAMFFHEDISRENLSRFIDLEDWLQNYEVSRGDLILSLIDDHRSDFWKKDAIAVESQAGFSLNFLQDTFKWGQDLQEPFKWGQDTDKKSPNDEQIQAEIKKHIMNDLTTRAGLVGFKLDNAEIMMENFDRLRGFELEIHSMRLSTHKEWKKLSDNYADQDHILIDREYQNRMNRLS